MKLDQTRIDKIVEKVCKNYDKYEWFDRSRTSCTDLSFSLRSTIEPKHITYNIYDINLNIKNNLIDHLTIRISDDHFDIKNNHISNPNIIIAIDDDWPISPIGYYITENDKAKDQKLILVNLLLNNIKNLVKLQNDKKQEEELKQEQLKDQQLKQEVDKFIDNFLKEENENV